MQLENLIPILPLMTFSDESSPKASLSKLTVDKQ